MYNYEYTEKKRMYKNNQSNKFRISLLSSGYASKISWVITNGVNLIEYSIFKTGNWHYFVFIYYRKYQHTKIPKSY